MPGTLRWLASLVAIAAAAAPGPETVPAFPGAEGAGRLSTGGRGGRVLRVTNLDDKGPGSLRAAVEAEGPRTIVFDVGGTIRLSKPLVIRNGRVTIAGQTAPGGGITLRDRAIEIRADDVIVRYIRSRLGDESRVESDAFTISAGRRIIVDHVSASWSVDETLSAGSDHRGPEDDLGDVSVQWSIISESLTRSLHAKGDHGYGSLLRGGRGARMSFHHNLWAHHGARMPRPGNYLTPGMDSVGAYYDFRSNVFYDWGGSYAGYNADSGEKASHAAYNFVDNVYRRGPASKKPIAFDEKNVIARAWFAGNSMDGAIPADPWSLVSGRTDRDYRLAGPLAMPPLTRDPAPRAYSRVLAGAGASRVRDPVDERVIASVRRRHRRADRQPEPGRRLACACARSAVARHGRRRNARRLGAPPRPRPVERGRRQCRPRRRRLHRARGMAGCAGGAGALRVAGRSAGVRCCEAPREGRNSRRWIQAVGEAKMVGKWILTLVLLFTASLVEAKPARTAEPRIVAEAKAFMAAYAADLLAGDRAAIAGRYSRRGAYTLGWNLKRFEDQATIARSYASSNWQKPHSFSWTELSFEPLSADSIVVVGGFLWGADDKTAPLTMTYTALLRREAGGLKIRVEHENLIGKPPATP